MIWRIRLWGIVQGVGLRPLAVRLARARSLAGTVQNRGGHVEIWISGPESDLHAFCQQLASEKSAPTVLIRQEITLADKMLQPPQTLPNPFAILPSDHEAGTSFPAPDLPVCPDCERELLDPASRRFGHPFISCMHCGPRFSILDRLPYDRDHTVMDRFPLCPACETEYHEPSDRRFHAQTIACPDCGPVLSWQGNPSVQSDPVSENQKSPAVSPLVIAIARLKAGKIIAVKAIGGYHLACDPFSEQSVALLRQIKGRERKPFAVLFPDLASIAAYAAPNAEEAMLLLSSARPIVLLNRRFSENSRTPAKGTASESPRLAESVCGDSPYLGALLPSTPIQILLARACGPLVMTSANLTDENLIFKDEDMLVFLARQPALSGVLGHDRPILSGLDDSVVRIIHGRRQMIRRSRGFVPQAIDVGQPNTDVATDDMKAMKPVEATMQTALALGGDLKATAAVANDGFVWLTQPVGDLGSAAVLKEWQFQISHLLSILDKTPALVCHDPHPGYESRRIAQQYECRQVPIQHHHAHVVSVMAEHHLKEPVIGVAFDGTGFGPDGTVWGGEFLLCHGPSCKRLASLRPVLLPGGDSGMRDAWRSLAGYLNDLGLPDAEWPVDDPSGRWQLVRAALRHQVNCLPNSSMGRLFDAVCALVGLSEINHFEGECGSLLESQARRAQRESLEAWPMDFSIHPDARASCWQADASPVVAELVKACRDLELISPHERVQRVARLSLGFHAAVSRMVVAVCLQWSSETGVRSIALSGGVFQNAVLTEMLDIALTQAGFLVYWNEQVPSSDAGICLGQAWLSQQLVVHEPAATAEIVETTESELSGAAEAAGISI